jgi:hypothetical protein
MIRIESVPAGKRLYVECREPHDEHAMHWAWTIGEDQPAVDIPADWVPTGAIVTFHLFEIAAEQPATATEPVGVFMGIPVMDLEPVTDAANDPVADPAPTA